MQEKDLTAESFIQAAQGGTTATDGLDVIEACTVCEHPVSANADIRLCLIGADTGTFGVEGVSEKGEKGDQ